MFGYQESNYDVEKSVVIQTQSGEQKIELRVEEPPSQWMVEMAQALNSKLKKDTTVGFDNRRANKYIAIEGKSIDLLFFYKPGQEADLDSDWQRLVNEPEVKVEELKWFEKVTGHGTGETRDGAYIMY
jgi:hypothetical protein